MTARCPKRCLVWCIEITNGPWRALDRIFILDLFWYGNSDNPRRDALNRVKRLRKAEAKRRGSLVKYRARRYQP